jgi:hypothetical protein
LREVLPLVTELRCAGILFLGRIAAELNRRQVAAPRGGRWHRTTVKRILVRQRWQAAGYALSQDQQMAIKRARIAAFDRRLRSTVERLMRTGRNTTDQVVNALNRTGLRTFIVRPWKINSLNEYLRNHCLDLHEELRGNRKARWGRITEAFATTEGLTQEQRAAEFNLLGVPAFFGHVWNKGNISQVARRLGFAQSLEQRAGERAQAKAVLDGIARHRGINRESPLTNQEAAAELTRRLGRVVTRFQIRGLSPRRRIRQPFWTAERRAHVMALHRAGKTVVEIAWEYSGYGKTPSSIRTVLWRLRRGH